MGLSEHLQSCGILQKAEEFSPESLLESVLSEGRTYFASSPAESEKIRHNLALFGIDDQNGDLIKSVQEHILFHYYEKFLGLCLDPADFKAYLLSRVDYKAAEKSLRQSLSGERGILLASCHFGAIEFVVPTLASLNLPVNGVLRFKTAALSAMVRDRAALLMKQGGFGKIGFVEIGKPGSAAAMEMAAVLRRREILLSMFDEKTDYSVKVELLGKNVWGGAGLDRLVKFSGAAVDIFSVFMVRTLEQHYRLEIEQVSPDEANPTQALFNHLTPRAVSLTAQWYFLHEDIPFA